MKAGNLGFLLGGGVFRGHFSWDLKEKKKWTKNRRKVSACPQHSCNRKQMGRFHGQREGKSGWNRVQKGEVLTRSQGEPGKHLIPGFAERLTWQLRAGNERGQLRLRELYTLGHLLIKSQVATTGQELCTDQSGLWVVDLSSKTYFPSELSKLLTISSLYV